MRTHFCIVTIVYKGPTLVPLKSAPPVVDLNPICYKVPSHSAHTRLPAKQHLDRSAVFAQLTHVHITQTQTIDIQAALHASCIGKATSMLPKSTM